MYEANSNSGGVSLHQCYLYVTIHRVTSTHRFTGKTLGDESGNDNRTGAALHERFDGCRKNDFSAPNKSSSKINGSSNGMDSSNRRTALSTRAAGSRKAQAMQAGAQRWQVTFIPQND